MPLIYFFGSHIPGAVYPGTKPIAQMSPSDLWSSYIRPMGAGAVAAAGLITLIKTMPTIISALSAGLKNIGKKAMPTPCHLSPLRTDRDLPMWFVLGGSVALVVLIFRLPHLQASTRRADVGLLANLAASVLILIFGFLFVTVSSRIVGLIGSSANPVSGITIATLMATSAIFLVKGWTAPAFGALAITIGGTVCIAAANAGDTSQDLKTGYLIGATPWKQQLAVMIGVCVSTVVIGVTLNAMNRGLEEFRRPIARGTSALPHDGVVVQQQHFTRAHFRLTQPDKSQCPPTMVDGNQFMLLNALGSADLADGKYLYNPATGHRIEVQWIQGIGSEKGRSAPQARLMATVINGILTRKLPWGLVLLGVFLVIAVELLGIRSSLVRGRAPTYR